MTEAERNLAAILKSALALADSRSTAVTVHLFGIDHAAELRGVSMNEVVRLAGLSPAWATEVRKGVRLADFVRRRR